MLAIASKTWRGDSLDEALVDAHLIGVPGLGTLTARGLAGGDLEVLGGETDGALDAEVLVLGAVDELLADLLEGLDLAGGEGDADLVDLGTLSEVLLLVVRHFGDVLRGSQRANSTSVLRQDGEGNCGGNCDVL